MVKKKNRIKQGNNKLTHTRVIKAIKDNNGMKTYVAKQLGVTYNTVYNYLLKYPELDDYCQEIKENIIDICEQKIYEKIVDGDLDTIKYYLSHQGSHRGYNKPKLELNQTNNYNQNNLQLNLLSSTIPVTPKQQELANLYYKELKKNATN
jgi:hypothetical protein